MIPQALTPYLNRDFAVRLAAWSVAAMWVVRTLPAIAGLRQVPDLLKMPAETVPAG